MMAHVVAKDDQSSFPLEYDDLCPPEDSLGIQGFRRFVWGQ